MKPRRASSKSCVSSNGSVASRAALPARTLSEMMGVLIQSSSGGAVPRPGRLTERGTATSVAWIMAPQSMMLVFRDPLRRRLRPDLRPGVHQVVLDGRVRQAEPVGGRLLRPGDEDGGDHADLTVGGAFKGAAEPERHTIWSQSDGSG